MFMSGCAYYRPQTSCRIFRYGTTMRNLKLTALISLLVLGGCRPTVQLAAPSEPITINLNVRIEHEIRVKVDKELDEVFAENSDLF